ncbi:hypothetical protein GGI05_007896, partial [Coemansia sp. RSA 2603]
MRLKANVADLSTPSIDIDTETIWQHAVAGVESGLAGTSALVYNILYHRRMSSTSLQSSSDDIHRLCHQAAKALKRCPARGYEYPDVLRLSLVLSQYVHTDGPFQSPDESAADAFSQAILQFCRHTAKLQWPLGLFAKSLASALKFQQGDDLAFHHTPVVDSGWNTEIRVNQTLQGLDLFDNDMRVCERVLTSLSAVHQPDSVKSSTAVSISSLSPAQWLHVAHGLLKSIEQCTENEY